MIRVLLVDDHPVVRQGLHAMLDAEADLTVVGEVSSGAEAVEFVANDPPDVVLMDLRMPGVDGAIATAKIVASGSRCRVVVLTTYETDTDILRAVEAGATGYLLNYPPPAELVAAIRGAARGETVLAPTVAGKLVGRVRSPPNAQRWGPYFCPTPRVEPSDTPCRTFRHPRSWGPRSERRGQGVRTRDTRCPSGRLAVSECSTRGA